MKRNNKSGYRGVTWDGRRNSWRATIVRNYKQKHIGNFESVIDAAEAYNKAAIELFGEKAKLNLIKREMSV
ncbi:AP2 domain-containing protein [Bacillus bruguierae]|uniref:AP2 domain-containing protein n=1 Tax=Bacillus bruguierae TaxID=3127667 RepID=UPI0039B769C2